MLMSLTSVLHYFTSYSGIYTAWKVPLCCDICVFSLAQRALVSIGFDFVRLSLYLLLLRTISSCTGMSWLTGEVSQSSHWGHLVDRCRGSRTEQRGGWWWWWWCSPCSDVLSCVQMYPHRAGIQLSLTAVHIWHSNVSEMGLEWNINVIDWYTLRNVSAGIP